MTSSKLLYMAAALLALAVVLIAVSCMAAAARLFSQKEKQDQHTEEKES